jgi:O-antigen/teichoic acid export membrane protein
MINNLKNILKHSFVYGISNVAQKASGIILLPLFTHFLSVEEYGRYGLLFITTVIISQSLVLGQSSSVIRYNNSANYSNQKKSIFFTLTTLVIAVTTVFVVLSEIYIDDISGWLGSPVDFKIPVRVCIYIIAIVTINNVLLGKIRADEKSVLYTVAGLVKILIQIGFTIYFLVVLEMGLVGVLLGQLTGEISTILVVAPSLLRAIEFKFEKSIVKDSLRFGLPLVFSAVAINLLNGSDRYIIKFLIGERVLGLYELGYRVAGIINMILIIPFNLSLLPMAYKVYQTEGDKDYYKKLKTYLAFILVWAGLALSLFSEEIVEIFALNPSYYSAYTVVPYIILAYIIYGISTISSLGMYLSGKNFYMALITMLCASINIGLNFWLIPQYGIMAAAVSTVIAFFIQDTLSVIASNKYYRIKYEYFKLIKIFTAGIALYIVTVNLLPGSLIIDISVKLFVSILFPLVCILIGCFEKKELAVVKKIGLKWRNPKEWLSNFRKEMKNFNRKE